MSAPASPIRPRASFALLSCAVLLACCAPAVRADLVAQFTFEGASLSDTTGNWPDLVLEGDASLIDGQLDVNGGGTTATGWAHTSAGDYTGPPLTDKTLVAWLSLQADSPTARAGSALTIDTKAGDVFDGIIFAEQAANRWMNGSNGFVRTMDFGATADEPGPFDGTNEIQMAITYEDLGGGSVQITGYRNGLQIGQYTDDQAGQYANWTASNTELILGKRHGNPLSGVPGALDALIQEVRIYDEVLSEAQVAALSLEDPGDTDRDGLPDDWEQGVIDADPNDAIETLADVNPGDDLDGDNLSNLQEFMDPQTDPLDADSDDDTLNDDVETNTGIFVNSGDTGTDPNNPDSDGDGLPDAVETATRNFVSASNTGTDPNTADTDGDGLGDGEEVADPFTDPNDAGDPPPPPAGLDLIGHWTFEEGEELVDLTGHWPDLVLKGDAAIVGGQLDVNGAGTTATGWAHSGPGDYAGLDDIGEKTLVSWLTVQSSDSTASAGSAITIDTRSGDIFDGIIFAEQDANRWMAGSNGFVRTMNFGPSADEPSTDGTEEIMMAIIYEDLGGGGVQITAYRNGVQIGQYTDDPFATWSPTNVEIIFGKRHGDPNSGTPGGLDALIQEARIYSGAATAEQILDLFHGGAGGGEPFQLTAISYDEAAGEVTIEWVSRVGATYALEWSPDLGESFWIQEIDDYPLGGATSARTTFTFPNIPPGTGERYFRVLEE